MQKQDTASGGSPQGHPNPRTSADNTSVRREWTRRKFQFLAAAKSKLSSDSGRQVCTDLNVSHRLAAEVANEIVTGPYRSLVSYGHVYIGQKALGELLRAHERQIRRAVAALVELGLLQVERDHRARRTNLMVPLLDGRPLFAEIGCTEPDGANPSSNLGARAPSAKRASAPSDFKGEEERKDSSPVDPSTSEAVAPQPAPMEEEIQTEIGTTNEAKCPRHRVTSPESKSSPSAAGTAAGSAIEVNFAVLMRRYPHPARQRQQVEAYEPHALASWRKLTPAEKALSVEAAPMAPGNRWLGHWLDRGRERGNFEVVERQPAVHRVWVREGTPQWHAWEDHRRANGQRPLKTQRAMGGERQIGWMFESEWPPAVERAPNPEVCDD
jgi:DNA-binding MarR family transcriptional regulator